MHGNTLRHAFAANNTVLLHDLFSSLSFISLCNPDELEQAFYYPFVGVFTNQNILGSNPVVGDCFFIQNKLQCCGRPLRNIWPISWSRVTLSLHFSVFLVHCAVTAVLIYFLLVELCGRKHNFRGWAQPKFTAGRRRKIFSHSKPLWGCQRRRGSSDTRWNGKRPLQNQHTNQPKYLHALNPSAQLCQQEKLAKSNY